MSYQYYKEELSRLPTNDPDGYGLSIQIRASGSDVHTKWLSLTDECRHELLAFLLAGVDPESMTDKERAAYWENEYKALAALDEQARKELSQLLANPICPATWSHIIAKVKTLKEGVNK